MTFDPQVSAFMFPGQGSQAVGMGRELASAYPAARAIFTEADGVLGFAFSGIMWNGPESALNDTLNTQPALFVHSMAAFSVFQDLYAGVMPVMVAGHSLGQLSAIAASGAISFSAGLQLVRRRGELMKRAGEINPGGMAAIMGLDIPTLDKVCAESSTEGQIVQVANDNSPGQVVISGHSSAMERALAKAKEAGARRAIPLAVSIAAHSPLMISIQDEWNQAVDAAGFVDARVPVIGNVVAGPIISADALVADVKAQMQSRVRWTESVRYMASQGVTRLYEVGVGTVLGGLAKRITDTATAYPLGNPADFGAL